MFNWGLAHLFLHTLLSTYYYPSHHTAIMKATPKPTTVTAASDNIVGSWHIDSKLLKLVG